jgi:hypothetical protein
MADEDAAVFDCVVRHGHSRRAVVPTGNPANAPVSDGSVGRDSQGGDRRLYTAYVVQACQNSHNTKIQFAQSLCTLSSIA